MFGWQDTKRQFDMILQAKKDENLLTLAAFEEMIELNEIIFLNV